VQSGGRMRASEGRADEQRSERGQLSAVAAGAGDAFDSDGGHRGYQCGRRDGLAERGAKRSAPQQGNGDHFGSAGGDPGSGGADCLKGEQLDDDVAHATTAMPAAIAQVRMNGALEFHAID